MIVRGIFTNISGSTGGVTGSRNKGGQYLRARVTPVNPNSSAQQQARSRFTDANDGWSGLTPGERAAWNDFAELQSWTNRIGEPIQLSGQQAYVGAYSASVSVGLTPATAPPAPNTRPAALVIPTFAPSITNGDVGTFTAGVLTAGDRYSIAVSAALPPGVNSFKGPYRQIDQTVGNTDAAGFSEDVFNAIQGRVGVPTVGQRFAIRIRAITTLGNYSAFAERISGPTIA